MDTNAMLKLEEYVTFVDEFSEKILDPSGNESAKKVYFLDVKDKTVEALNFFKVIEGMVESINTELAEGSTEKEIYDKVKRAKTKLTSTMLTFQNAQTPIAKDVKEDDTKVSVTDETIKQAMETDKSTQQIAKDMKDISAAKNAPAVPFTHVVCTGGKYILYTATTKEELIAIVNDAAASCPGEVPQLYSVTLNPIPVKSSYTI